MKRRHLLVIAIAVISIFTLTNATPVSARGAHGGGHFGGGHASSHISRGGCGSHFKASPKASPKAKAPIVKAPKPKVKASADTKASTSAKTGTVHGSTKSSSNQDNKKNDKKSTFKTVRNGKTITVNQHFYNSHTSGYDPYHRRSLLSEFGHSMVCGAGWSIGSSMGNSIWHRFFGMGGNSYQNGYGETQYAPAGYSGIVVLVVIIAIVAGIIYLVRRNRKNAI